VRGYDALFDRPFPYVMAVHQAPTSLPSGADSRSGHLHVEFYPPLRTAEKLKYLAGSEQGAGTFVSDTLPEESALALREAIARGA
jgi:UDPglucose--hexose-1-phosphate uridylyltransferase